MQPKDIFEVLNQDVIGQEETLRFVSVAIVKHLQGERFGNLMLIGNSGTGKTTVMRSMERFYSELEDHPQYRLVVIINANTFASEDGGIHTTELFERLEESATRMLGDAATPQEIASYMENATVCLDEIDKVSGIVGGKPYVTGLNIQQALLTMIEGEKVFRTITGHVDGQLVREAIPIDTGKMLFLCAGAFEKLYDQVYERVTAPTSRVKLPSETIYIDGEVQIREYFTLRHHFKQEDLFDYGMQPQFLSRFDNSIILSDLDGNVLKRIFLETRDSVFPASQRFFRNYGIEIEITEGAVQIISDEAAKSARIGARALKAVYGRIIKPFEFDPFSHPEVKVHGEGHRLFIDEALVARALKSPLETA